MLFAVGIVGLIFIGAVLCGLVIGWFTLHHGESFQERYAKGVLWKFVADIVFGGIAILLILLAKWLGEKTGVW